MKKSEAWLLIAVLAMTALAMFGPTLAQPLHPHDFADRRMLGGLPFAMDVVSNLPFALWGVAGLLLLARRKNSLFANAALRVEAALGTLFFGGLVVAAAASSWYHLQPQDASLLIDRLGMTVAFAGLLGLAAAGRVSPRAGLALAATVLVLGPLGLQAWLASGNILPWAVMQFGGMAVIVGLACTRPLPLALPVSWLAVIALYALAKLFELADHQVFELTGQLVSGHSLKHVVASFAALPVIAVIWRHPVLRTATPGDFAPRAGQLKAESARAFPSGQQAPTPAPARTSTRNPA